MIRAVTFDCWNTILRERSYDGARNARAECLSEAVNLPIAECAAVLDCAWSEHHRRWVAGEVFAASHMARFALTECRKYDDELHASLSRSFEDASLGFGAELVPGAAETVKALADRGIFVAMICDTGWSPGRVVRRLLADHGVVFSGWAFSDEVGQPKPSPSMFSAALAQIGVRADEAVHVGDLKRTDVAGARGAGMRAIRFRGAFDDPADLPDAPVIIDELSSLLGWLALAGAV
jgi:putative hydrolase of the HAD superfamily